MGTDKRERQKANRQLKLGEMARDARKRKTKKRALQIGIGIPVLILVLFGLVRLFSPADTSKTVTHPCPPVDGSAARVGAFAKAPPPSCLDAAKTYSVVVKTNVGSYTADLDATKAPLAVNSFVYLARYHFFDNTPCHRIIPSFVVQCGSPDGSGNGGPGFSFADELPAAGQYKLGSLAMANSGANTNGSQFFVISGAQGIALPPKYTLFGQVTSGLDTVSKLDALGSAAGTPTTAVTIESVTVTEK